ncbi:DNA-binding protein [Aviadenovirus cerasi]|uniref:DNA-binding protein n=1 Tax=Fowl aviadenovirus 5 TaxID=172861 RepID=A0A6M3Z5N9_9ADEN|nr:DNA-binding protein [Fowl aviadenovirus 5]
MSRQGSPVGFHQVLFEAFRKQTPSHFFRDGVEHQLQNNSRSFFPDDTHGCRQKRPRKKVTDGADSGKSSRRTAAGKREDPDANLGRLGVGLDGGRSDDAARVSPTSSRYCGAARPLEEEDADDPAAGTDEDAQEDEVQLTDPVIFGAQKAMNILATICERLDVRWQGATIRPDDAIWTKMGGTFMRKRHPEFRLTFSSFDSFHAQVGRFLAAMIYGMAELEPKFVPGGAHVWRHGWNASTTIIKCMHGMPMVMKPRTVELNPSSEAGKRAMAEQNGPIEKNRFGRQVVVLRFDRNAVCSKDADHSGFPYPHAIGSCGMVFSDAAKAVSAMRHDIEWTKALYPNADKQRAEECVLISTNCNCNYASEGPISGRQLCRMIPYKLSGTDDITADMAHSRPDMKAHKKYPHTMVFTCCNPQSPTSGGYTGGGPRSASGRGKSTEKTCAWRLSAMDLRYAYVFATELVTTVMGVQAPTHVPEFRWNDRFAFKTEVIAPVKPLDTDDPFA